MKLFIESEIFIYVLFYFIWHDSLGNNAIKSHTETGLSHLETLNSKRFGSYGNFFYGENSFWRLVGVEEKRGQGDADFELRSTSWLFTWAHFNTILDSIGFRKEKGYFYLLEV